MSYKLLHPLGEGAFGRVYLASKDGEKVAIKRISKSKLQSSKAVRRVKDEIRILRALSKPECHPHILCFRDFYEDSQYVYIVTEYVEGVDLRKAIFGSTDEILEQVMIPLLQALQYIHDQGFVHNDIKLENIILSNEGPKIIDFGFGCSITEGIVNVCDFIIKGTPNYIAPEVWKRNVRSLEEFQAVDVYALGVVFYFLFKRRMPYQAKNQDDLRAQVLDPDLLPAQVHTGNNILDEVIMGMLEKDPRQRLDLQFILYVLYILTE